MDIFDDPNPRQPGDLPDEFGFAALSLLDGIGFLQGLVVGHASGHQPVLDEQVVDEELQFPKAVLLVDPEFMQGDEPEAEVLSEIRELLVDVFPDVLAVHDPDR